MSSWVGLVYIRITQPDHFAARWTVDSKRQETQGISAHVYSLPWRQLVTEAPKALRDSLVVFILSCQNFCRSTCCQLHRTTWFCQDLACVTFGSACSCCSSEAKQAVRHCNRCKYIKLRSRWAKVLTYTRTVLACEQCGACC